MTSDQGSFLASIGVRTLVEVLVGLILGPLLATAISRLTPQEWPLWLPFVAVALIGAVAAFMGIKTRFVGIGLLAGVVLYGLLFILLLGQFDGLSQI